VSYNLGLLKKAWHILIALWAGFLLSAMLVGGILVRVGLIAEQHSSRITFVLTPVVAALAYYAFYVYNSRGKTQIQAGRHGKRRTSAKA
jgi:hypothetical protein